tara:strand:+ start:35082 stop:35840 length:759 start_codon:yes stop_codon:yes gene_type:complete
MTSKISWMITGRLIDLVENLMKNSTLCVHARNNWRMGTEVFQIFADFLQAWSGRKETRADMIRRGQKKTTHLEIRISPLKKEAFMKACEDNDTNASDAVRTFVDAYIAQSRHLKLKQIARGITMTILQNPVKSAAGFTAPIAGTVAAAFLMAAPGSAETYLPPLEPPVPYYPIEMAERGISAECEARFAVSKTGYVEPGFKVDCSRRGFDDAVKAAVSKLKFEPQIRDGEPVRVENAVYPIVFEINPVPDDQ